MVSHRLRPSLDLSATWVYGTGQAITLPVGQLVIANDRVYGRFLESARSVAISRCAERSECSADAGLPSGWISPSVGTSSALGPTGPCLFGVYNAYSRRNAFSVYADTNWRTGECAIQEDQRTAHCAVNSLPTQVLTITRYLPLLLALAACETVISIDPPDYESEIAATSLFTPDSVWTARISRTIPVDQAGRVGSPFLDNASVSVWEGDQLVDRLVYDDLGTGIYQSQSGRTPEPNKLYRLEVEAPGYGRVEATSALPVAPQITELSLDLQSGEPGLRPRYSLRFRLKDSPDAAFYSFGAYLVYASDSDDGGDSEDIQIEPLSMAQEDPTSVLIRRCVESSAD